jgi:hypothetical protein
MFKGVNIISTSIIKMDLSDTGEKRYEKVDGKWILKDKFKEEPKTKTIQKKWKEYGIDGSIVECVDEVNVPIDHEENNDSHVSNEPIKEAFMKPLSMGDLCFHVEDYNYVAFQTMEERYFTREQLNNYAIQYDVNYKKYKNKKLLLEALKKAWDDYFIENPEFKAQYYEAWTS